MTALLVGTALAVASLCYVLRPLYRAEVAVAPRAPGSPKTRENITAIDTMPAERATLDCFVEGEVDSSGSASDSGT